MLDETLDRLAVEEALESVVNMIVIAMYKLRVPSDKIYCLKEYKESLMLSFTKTVWMPCMQYRPFAFVPS